MIANMGPSKYRKSRMFVNMSPSEARKTRVIVNMGISKYRKIRMIANMGPSEARKIRVVAKMGIFSSSGAPKRPPNKPKRAPRDPMAHPGTPREPPPRPQDPPRAPFKAAREPPRTPSRCPAWALQRTLTLFDSHSHLQMRWTHRSAAASAKRTEIRRAAPRAARGVSKQHPSLRKLKQLCCFKDDSL